VLALWLQGLMGFQHTSVRAALAALTAFAVSVVVGGWMIRALRRGGVVEDTSQPDHAGLDALQRRKKGIPTMGGLMIVAGLAAGLLLWSNPRYPQVQIGALVMGVLAALGLADDMIKLRGKRRGLSKKEKLIVQFALGAVVGWLLIRTNGGARNTTVSFLPFTDRMAFNLGHGYILWTAFVIAAASNAVNLADGLDGLAGGCSAIAAAALAVLGGLAVVRGGPGEGLSRLPAAPELCIFAAAVAGGVLGFLWYNAHPAQIFMGDTGSLMLGGVLGYLALALKLDLVLLLVGIVFFVDEATVALQILGYKASKKRIFPIAPIHHYFQVHLKWPEQKISTRLWIIGGLAAVAAAAVIRL
jgi:phospho-N-acetylmuramoyl-pentapeptide-transferase